MLFYFLYRKQKTKCLELEHQIIDEMDKTNEAKQQFLNMVKERSQLYSTALDIVDQYITDQSTKEKCLQMIDKYKEKKDPEPEEQTYAKVIYFTIGKGKNENIESAIAELAKVIHLKSYSLTLLETKIKADGHMTYRYMLAICSAQERMSYFVNRVEAMITQGD